MAKDITVKARIENMEIKAKASLSGDIKAKASCGRDYTASCHDNYSRRNHCR